MTDDSNTPPPPVEEGGAQPCGSPAREEIEKVIEECAKEEPVVPVKVKKPRAKAKPTITKEEIVLAVLEATKPPTKPDKPDKNKELVPCPDCGLTITYHNLRYTHKRYCKGAVGVVAPPLVVALPPPPPALERTTTVSDDIVNTYIKNNPEIVTSYLRNERANKTNRRQVNAKALLIGAL
jgi:hypothetical protein